MSKADLKALAIDTLIMSVEDGFTNYYQKTAEDWWATMGDGAAYSSAQIHDYSEGRWAVVRLPEAGQ